jgi:hypothetical protein
MSSREQHYAKIREALTDALSKIETDDEDDDDRLNVMMIPTPFVEFQDEFPEQMYPEVRIQRAIGGGVGGVGSSSSSKNNSNNNGLSEVILVESSTNSFRVSVKLKHSDELDAILTKQLSRFMRQRAEQFSIVRKKAINSDAFDLSFLVTQKHKKQFVNSSLVTFMVDFLKSVDGEISEQKLSVSSRGRAVVEEFLGGFC